MRAPTLDRVSAPQDRRSNPEIQILIPEARARRQTRLRVIVAVVLLASAAASLLLLTGRGSHGGSNVGPPGLRLPPPVTATALRGLQRSPAYDFAAAKQQWEGEWQVVSGAIQNAPLVLAESDLELGIAAKTPGAARWLAVIREIKLFAGLPLTSVTPTQSRVAIHAWNQINRFFGFGIHPRTWYGLPSGRSYLAALKAWGHEPLGTSAGVRVAELRIAIAELKLAIAANPRADPLYGPAIADLSALETATRSDVATSATWTSATGAEIAFLNGFFNDFGRLAVPVLGGS